MSYDILFLFLFLGSVKKNVDFRFRMLAFHGARAEPPGSTRCGSCMRYDRTS